MANSAGYVNPGGILAIIIVFPVLGAIALAARFWSKRLSKQRKGLYLDDYFAIGTWVILLACSIDLGIGRAVKTVGYRSDPHSYVAPNVVILDKVELAFNQMWMVGISCAKACLLFLYLRLFKQKTYFKVAINIWIVLTFAWCICFFFLNFFECGRNVDQQWNPELPPFANPRYCLDSVAILFANALVDCILDLGILILPMPVIWTLKMPTRTKIAIMWIFGLGAFCIAASAMRLVAWAELWYGVHFNVNVRILGNSAGDDLGVVSTILFWSHIELGVAAVVCNLPCIRPVFTHTRLNEFFSSLVSHASLSSLRSRQSNERSGATNKAHAHELGRLPALDSTSVTATADYAGARDQTGLTDDDIYVQTKVSTLHEITEH